MKMLASMGRTGLSTMSEEESVEKRIGIGLPLTPSLSLGASGEHRQTSAGAEETSKGTTEHPRRSLTGQEHQRRPLSLPLFSVQRAQAIFRRTSLRFLHTSSLNISSGIIDDSSAPDRPHFVQLIHEKADGSMDRRRTAIGGPRAPVAGHNEEQRTQAFESIFGAPSTAHRDLQHRPTQRTLPTNPNVHQQQQQQHYNPPYRQQPNQPRFLQPLQPQTYSRSPQQYTYAQPNYSRPVPGCSPSPDSIGYYSNAAVAPLSQGYMSANQPRHVIPPGALLPPQQTPTPNPSVPPRLDSLLTEDGGKLSLDFMSENGHGGIVIQGPEDNGLEDDSELPWIKSGQRTPTSNWPGRRASVQAQPPPSSVGSSTPPSSVDYHDHKSSAPPRLNLDFGTHSSLSGDTNSDPSSSGRTSVDSARATPPMVLPHLNTHTATPSPQLSSASSSIARRSLQAENPRMRAPLSQLTFPQNSITNTSSSSISGSNNVPGTPISQTSTNVGRRIPKRAPLVYPALLSRVADALLRRLPLSVRVKDGLSYPDAFDGREAVDKICYIIKTTDRSLALLLGRALDAQKFFHDVTYDHRLRDNPVEIYQFRSGRSGLGLTTSDPGTMGHTRGDSLSMSAGSMSHRPSASKSSTIESSPHNGYGDHAHYSGSEVTVTNSQTPHDDQIPGEANNMGVNEMELPTGVFTMLTECYSATCTRDQICYSITCPRRMEQQARANMLQRPGSAGGRASNTVPATPKAGRRATIDNGSGPTSPIGSMSGHGHGTQPQAGGIGGVPRMTKNADGEAVGVADDDDDRQESGQLWIHSVPKEVADALSDQEKKRQEAINEVIYTERDFVRDMEYLRDVWVAGIHNSEVIPIERRDAFISQVFWNILAIIEVNTRLRDLLSKRQKQYTVVGEIGDIFKEIVPLFEPFVDYGAHQMYGKYEFEKEKGNNPAFAAFVDEIERLPETRRLELNGYLTKPTTRLARYPLLLEAVIKHTPESSPDKVTLQEVVQTVRGFLSRVNQKTGEAENRFHLHQLERQLAFRQGEYVDLRLTAENRKMVYKGSLNRRGGAGDKEDLQVFLFDHALLIVKQKTKGDQYKVHRRPIPLELLIVSAADEAGSTPTVRPSTTGRVGGKAALHKPGPQHDHHSLSSAGGHSGHLSLSSNGLGQGGKNGFPITFTHLGWRGYSITLWATTFISKKKWLENIQKQQDLMHERSRVFETVPFSEGYFVGGNRVNCAAPFNDGVRIAYGTDDGVYFSDFREPKRPPVKMLALLDVTQVDILHESQELIVLTAGTVFTFPLEVLDPMDPTAALKRGKRIAAHTSFFKAGVCNKSFIVCVVKTTALSTTVKTFEPIDQSIRGKSKPTFKKLLQGGNDTLKLYKEFYIPVESFSLTILQSRLCIGCARGFQIVDLETLDTQQLVDPGDPSLEFIDQKDNLRPLAIFRVDADFLLCYDEWAVFVDKRGTRARGDWRANWEGRPTAFAFHYPYVIAIEPSFVEIWDVVTCAIKQVIPGDNLRCLFAEPPPRGTMYSANTHQLYPAGPPNGVAMMGGPPPHMGGAYPPRGSSAQHLPSSIPPHLTYSGRPSLQGHGPILQPQVPGALSFGGPGFGRREIVIASDDSVLFLKLAPPTTVTSQTSDGVATQVPGDARQLPVR